ncbi:MAG: DNA polymerase III subunit beta, partial [Buchnera aphidicola]|nr:DNA polymerase III subunit beta [Buchnera aphidicola]
ISRKGIMELSRLLNIESTLINIFIGQNNIQIHINTLIFTTQLLEGKYPDYNSVLFKQSKYPIITNTLSLKKS